MDELADFRERARRDAETIGALQARVKELEESNKKLSRLVLHGSGNADADVKDSLFPIREMLARRQQESPPADAAESVPAAVSDAAPLVAPEVPVELRQREQIVAEIVATERQYVDNLRVLNSLYRNALFSTLHNRGAPPVLSESEFNAIFTLSPTILQLNVEMLGEMETRFAAWHPHESTLGDVFTRFGPLFKMYGPYCAGLGDAFAVVKRLRETSASFRELMALIGKLPDTRQLDLESFLSLPMQRVLRYVLLLEYVFRSVFFVLRLCVCADASSSLQGKTRTAIAYVCEPVIDGGPAQTLQSHTPTTHPDGPLLERAVLMLRDVARIVNQSVGRTERAARMLQLQQQLHGFPGTLLAPARAFVLEGAFQKITSKIVVTDWHLLFSDILVYCKRGSDSTLQFKGMIALERCWLRDLNDTPKLQNLLQLVAPDKTYVYHFASSEDKTHWMNAIQDCITKLVEINPLAVLERGAVKARRAHGLDALVGSLLSFAPEAVDPSERDPPPLEPPPELSEDDFVLIGSARPAMRSVSASTRSASAVSASAVFSLPPSAPAAVPPLSPPRVAAAPAEHYNEFQFWSLPIGDGDTV